MSIRALYQRSGSFSLAGKIIAAFGALAVIWLTTLIAGRESFGEIMIAYSFNYILAAAVAAQFQTVVLYHVSRSVNEQTDKLSAALFYGLTVGLVIAGLETLAAPTLANLMNKPEMAAWFINMAWMIPAFALNSILTTWYRARQDIPTMITYFEIMPLLYRLAFLGFIALLAAPALIPAAYALSYLAPFAVLYARKPMPLLWNPQAFNKWDMNYSLQMMISQFMSKSVSNIVLFLIGIFAPATVVADYTLASKFAQFLQLPKQIVSQIQMPRMGEQMAAGRHEELLQEFEAVRCISLAATILTTAFLLLFMPVILNWFGNFYTAYDLFIIIAIGAIVMAAFGSVGNYLGIAGYAGVNLVINGASLLFLVAVIFILVPNYGGMGAAIATTLGSFFLMLLMMLTIRHRDQLNTLNLSATMQMALCAMVLILASTNIISSPAAALALILVASFGLLEARPVLRLLLAA